MQIASTRGIAGLTAAALLLTGWALKLRLQAGKAQLLNDRIDAGILVTPGKRRYGLPVRNTGPVSLRWLDAEWACGCMVVESPLTNLAPGQVQTAVVELDPPDWPGEFKKEVRLRLTDGRRTLVLTATIAGAMDPSVLLDHKKIPIHAAIGSRNWSGFTLLKGSMKDIAVRTSGPRRADVAATVRWTAPARAKVECILRGKQPVPGEDVPVEIVDTLSGTVLATLQVRPI